MDALYEIMARFARLHWLDQSGINVVGQEIESQHILWLYFSSWRNKGNESFSRRSRLVVAYT
jgi:hypothetical protein